MQKAVSTQFKEVPLTSPGTPVLARRNTGRPHQLPPAAQGSDALTVELTSAAMIDDAFRSEWKTLERNAESPNPYFEHWFLEPALAHLDLKQEVRICVIRQSNGRLVGLAPLVFQSGYSKLPLKHVAIWLHPHCYNGTPLIAHGFAEAVFGALIDLTETRPGGARFFRFQHLPYDAATATAMTGACQSRGRMLHEQDRHERAILSTGQDYDTVMKAAMSGKKRKELRRQANRFSDLGETAFTELPINCSAIDAFLALENAGWKNDDPDGFPFARCRHQTAFFRDAMTAGGHENAVQCIALTLDNTPAAMLFSLRTGDRLSAFKTTYNEDLSIYSPGFRLIMEATRQMLDCHDFCTFDSCAKQNHPVVDRLWPERLPIVQLNIPSAHKTDKSLLALAATLEKLKIAALKRFAKNKNDGD